MNVNGYAEKLYCVISLHWDNKRTRYGPVNVFRIAALIGKEMETHQQSSTVSILSELQHKLVNAASNS